MAAPPMPASTAASQLDGPPPSPQMMGGGPMGQATPMSLDQLAPGQMTAGQMPPEVLTGVLQAAQRMDSLLDSFAQVAPDLALDFSMIKTALAATLAKLVERGAQPMSPTAVGAAPPMGGMDRGVAGGGAV